MSFASFELPEPDRGVEQLNEKGAQAAYAAAQLLCRETIELVYEGVDLYLQKDKEHHDTLRMVNYPVGQSVGYFVLQETLTAPRKEGEFVRTFSTKLEPRTPEPTHPYMKIHVPVGDTQISSYEMPSFDTVSEVYIERHEEDDTHWYAVNSVGLYEYIPLVLQDEDSSVLSDQGIWQWVNDRIPETLETIGRLFTQMNNWDTVPQVVDTIQPIEVRHDNPEE